MVSITKNKKESVQSVTSVPVSPDEERDARFKKYAIAMTIRTVCVVLLVFVEGWMLLFVAIGAIFLPYFAVVTANARSEKVSRKMLPVSRELN